MEWVQFPSSALGKDVGIMTHVLNNFVADGIYSSPMGFNFDTRHEDTFFIDGKTTFYNAPQKASQLLPQLEDRKKGYRHNQMFMVMGGDFQYMNAFQNYQFLDNMIDYMNTNYGDDYEFIYSTPSKYVDAVAAQNVTFPTRYEDMLPLVSNTDASSQDTWSGFFTSRALNKDKTRELSRLSHAASQLFSREMLS